MATNKRKQKRVSAAGTEATRGAKGRRGLVELEYPLRAKGRMLVEPRVKGTLKKRQYLRAVKQAAILHKMRPLGKNKRVVVVSSKDIKDSRAVSVAVP